MLKVAPKSAPKLIYGGYDFDELASLAKSASVQKLCYIGDEINKTLGSITNPKMNAEICIIKLSTTEVPIQTSVVNNSNKSSLNSNERAVHKESAKPEKIVPSRPTYDDVPFDVDIPKAPIIKEEPPKDIPVVAEMKKETVSASVVEPTGADADMWHNICSASKAELPIDVSININDTSVVVGQLDGDTLSIRVAPGFYFSRFNRQEVISVFSKAASNICGKIINVKMLELVSQQKTRRSLDELSSFPDVKFI